MALPPTTDQRARGARCVPFTIDADVDLGDAAASWSRSFGADVTVRRGDVPESLPHPESEGVAWQHARGRMVIRVPCGLRFLVQGGDTVRYALDGGASPADVRPFLLGTALVALAAQRGLLALRASAVADGEDVHAFTGPIVGKSTLAAALGVHGYPFFADGVLILDPAHFDTQARCHRWDELALWPGGTALAGVKGKGKVRGASAYPKRYAEPHRLAPCATGRLATLCHLATFIGPRRTAPAGEPDSIRMERLSGGDAIGVLIGALHCKPLLLAILDPRQVFHRLTGLGRGPEVLRLYRPMAEELFEAGVGRMAATLPGPAAPVRPAGGGSS